jgi:hypothetical protein
MRMLEPLMGALLFAAGTAMAQTPPGAADLMNAQREAMKALAPMNGAWRGEATTVLPGGERRTITQTERIGPFLGGTVKVIEGRGYDASGQVVFNAFGIISFDPATKAYSMRSYALGRKGDFALKPTADGYTWEVPAGPGAIVRYTATIKENRLHEVGDRIVGSAEPVRVFEMRLERIGDSDWPEQGAIAPR